MRGAWLDDDDQVGRHAWRHDGAAHWQDPTLEDPHWTPPSLRGGVHLPGPDGTHHAAAKAQLDMPRSRGATRGPWLSDFDDDVTRQVPPRPPPVERDRAARATRTATTARTRHRVAPGAQEKPAPGWTSALLGIGALFALGMVIAGAVGNSETRAAALVMVVLGLIAFPVLKRLADGRRDYQQILYAGLAFKVTMTIVRYYLASGGYYKTSDASDYDTYGRQIASQYLKHGQLPPWKTWTGTPFLRLVTGFVYTIVPASELAAFFVFAGFSFAGTLLFWKAVQKFAPPPSDRTYLLMLMFIPSFVYWPSALGKEAFIILCLGLTTYGFACMLENKVVPGIACIAAGIAGMTMVRPHIGVAVMIGLLFATVLAKQSGRRTGLIAMVFVLLIGGGFVISKANEFFKADITSTSTITAQLDAAGTRTGEGGSQFSPTPVSPQNFPFAVVTVLIRPFPWETSSVPELATALESLLIAWLIIKGLKDIRGRVTRENPLAIYALVVTLVFIVLFWQFSNFGILARQRTQIAPFMFMLLAMPVTGHLAKKSERKARRSGDRAWANWDTAHGGAPGD